MAEGIKGKNLEDLERDITCPVCQEHYSEPKVLPCLHYCCKQCILKLTLRTGTFSCPECHKETTLPEGGVEELKTAFFVKIAAHEAKMSLLEELGSLKQVTDSLSSAIEDIQTTKQEVEAQGDSVANIIHTSFNELHQILEKRKNELLHEASRKMQEKIDKLSEQEKNLSLANVEVQIILDYSERFLGHSSVNEVMSMQAEIRSRIQREVEEHSKSGRSMEPVEEVDMGVEVRCAEALQQLCQINSNITQLALDPAQCTVRGEGVKTAEVHQTAEVTLNTKLANNKITRRSAVVASQLKSLYNGSVVKCEVDQSGPGKYCIQYTPTVRGRHELTVSVDGQQVTGSPFPVFVSIPPTQLGKPVKVWDGIKDACGITTNSVGDVIVAEYEGDIIKLESNGKTSVLVKHSDSKMKMLESVSTDDEDNIYCTDDFSNKVMKCNKKGSNVQVYEVKHVEGPGHWGVTVVGDEVMLCEYGNKGTIMVYDREIKYVRCIEHDGHGVFKAVSADKHGNLYVTDCTSNCIQVFSNDGVFLRSFGYDSNGVKRLDGPYYVCVSGHYVYVTDGGHYVLVFTTAGDYVTSFGEHGGGNSDYSIPCGVCTDKDGFVYVADYGTERVQCF